jgi:nucleotide-binding universal stress UspA family protein
MQAKKILFPTDFSTASDAALEYAVSLASDTGASLLIVHVQEPMEYYGGDMYYGVPSPADPEVRRMLESIRPSDTAVSYQHRMELGPPAEVIVRIARDEHADLIVMGTHGRTGLRRMVMGSVAEQVVRNAPCPVLTLRQPQEAKKSKKKPSPAAS